MLALAAALSYGISGIAATLSATSARSNRFFSICFPMPLSSPRREDGSELMQGKSMARSRFQSVILASGSLRRTRDGYSRNSARWEAITLTREKGPDSG